MEWTNHLGACQPSLSRTPSNKGIESDAAAARLMPAVVRQRTQ